MEHVNITLPLELKTRAETLAREEGVSLEELVRELLEARLQNPPNATRFSPNTERLTETPPPTWRKIMTNTCMTTNDFR